MLKQRRGVMSKRVKVGGQHIELSHQDKLYFPEADLTKGDLVDYYRAIAETMLPHMQARPLSLQRFPDGLEGGGFYQKEVPDHFPAWIDRVTIEVKEKETTQAQVVCNKAETLVYLANQGCLTPHGWLSRSDRLHHPDRLIFDLDPPGDDFEAVRQAAYRLRAMLQAVELVPFVMTTGSQGLHLVVPLDRSADFDAVRRFARDVAERVVARAPEQLTLETQKDKRRGRLFLDYLRNAYAQTSVVPYAVRPQPQAPVATPLDWEELDREDLHPQRYTIENIFRRLGQKADPWREIDRQARSLSEARRPLEALD